MRTNNNTHTVTNKKMWIGQLFLSHVISLSLSDASVFYLHV